MRDDGLATAAASKETEQESRADRRTRSRDMPNKVGAAMRESNRLEASKPRWSLATRQIPAPPSHPDGKRRATRRRRLRTPAHTANQPARAARGQSMSPSEILSVGRTDSFLQRLQVVHCCSQGHGEQEISRGKTPGVADCADQTQAFPLVEVNQGRTIRLPL